MKTTVRIMTLALIFGLAGMLTAAWGAESVVNLITHGEALIVRIKSHKAAFDTALQNNNALVPEGQQLRVDMQQLQADIAAYQKQNDDIKQQTADYKSKCNSKQLSADQFTACKAQLAQINAAIDAVNSQPAKLKKRQKDIMDRATKYNQEVQTAPKLANAEQTAYHNAQLDLAPWLQKARIMVASPAFQPYAKKAGCPNVMKTLKTYEEDMTMSEEIVACLKKVASMN